MKIIFLYFPSPDDVQLLPRRQAFRSALEDKCHNNKCLLLLLLYLLLLNTFLKVQNVPLLSLGQLSWLGPLSRSCPLLSLLVREESWGDSLGAAKPLVCYQHFLDIHTTHSTVRAAIGKINSIWARINTLSTPGDLQSPCEREKLSCLTNAY